MTTRLLVLGGGRHQLPIIKRAEQRGIEVVLIDYLPDAPGRRYATHDLLQDALDIDRAIEAGRTMGIAGVITTGTDLAVVTMASVAEALGLPCYLTAAHARVATDKELMASALTAAGVRMARRVVVPPATGWSEGAMVVVKPADSQGQRGVSLAKDPLELEAALERARAHSKTGRVVVEQFHAGPEVTANAWVSEGELRLLAVTDRVTYNPPPILGVAFQHVYPSQRARRHLDEIATMLDSTAEAFGMSSGPLYVQFILGEGGPVLLEAGARGGGGHESSLLPLVIGEGLEDRLIDLALTGTCAPIEYDQRTAAAGAGVIVNFVLGSAGTVHSIADPEPAPGVVEAGYYIHPGQELTDVVDSLGRIGYFVARGSTPEEAQARAVGFYGTLQVRDERGRNLVVIPRPELLNRG